MAGRGRGWWREGRQGGREGSGRVVEERWRSGWMGSMGSMGSMGWMGWRLRILHPIPRPTPIPIPPQSSPPQPSQELTYVPTSMTQAMPGARTTSARTIYVPCVSWGRTRGTASAGVEPEAPRQLGSNRRHRVSWNRTGCRELAAAVPPHSLGEPPASHPIWACAVDPIWACAVDPIWRCALDPIRRCALNPIWRCALDSIRGCALDPIWECTFVSRTGRVYIALYLFPTLPLHWTIVWTSWHPQ